MMRDKRPAFFIFEFLKISFWFTPHCIQPGVTSSMVPMLSLNGFEFERYFFHSLDVGSINCIIVDLLQLVLWATCAFECAIECTEGSV